MDIRGGLIVIQKSKRILISYLNCKVGDGRLFLTVDDLDYKLFEDFYGGNIRSPALFTLQVEGKDFRKAGVVMKFKKYSFSTEKGVVGKESYFIIDQVAFNSKQTRIFS